MHVTLRLPTAAFKDVRFSDAGTAGVALKLRVVHTAPFLSASLLDVSHLPLENSTLQKRTPSHCR